MSENKNPQGQTQAQAKPTQATVVEDVPTFQLGAGSLLRIKNFIEMRKRFDGRERSVVYVLEEAIDKGIDALVRSTENSVMLRNQKEYDNWCKNHPQPELFLPDGTTLNPHFVEWQRQDAGQKRKYGIGATKVAL